MTNLKLKTCIMLGATLLMISDQLPFSTRGAIALAATTSSPAAPGVDAAGARLLAAAEPFEALTEMSFSALGLHLQRLVADADAAAQGARALLPLASQAQIDSKLAEIHRAHKADDKAGLAIASVEAYRILVSAAPTGKVPTAVNLMDYAGFRYDADFRAKPIRWPDMKAAAAYAREQWNSISSKITDRTLTQSVDAALSDMQLAADTQNTFKARRSVSAELGFVDDLEKYFSNR
jgi:hypothetical protein